MARVSAKKNSKKIIIVIIVIIAALLVGGFAGIKVITKPYDSSKTDTTFVEIPSGSSTEQIGNILVENKMISSVTTFKIYSKFKGYSSKYQAGFYALSPSMTMKEICEIISQGKVSTLNFTIPEGYNEYEIADLLSEKGIVDKDKFIDLLENHDWLDEFSFLKNAQSGTHRLEGYLFPSTYSVSLDATEEDIIRAMLTKYDSVFTDEYRARAKELNMTENQILTIASLVEKEAGISEDQAKVSSVIYNRLEKNMMLQMCSSVIYVLKLQGINQTYVTYENTKIDSPYNTYKNYGLPPGPICCPGEAAIKAALYPEDTDYIYFVVSDKLDGSSNFTSSYSEFEKYTEAYSKALKKQESSSK